MTSKAFENAVDANRQQGGRRNLIINGAMQVAQRGTSSTSTGIQTVDRFEAQFLNTDQLVATQSQSTDAPDGFSNSFKINADTAETTVDADDLVRIRYKIEAQDLQHLNYGSSSAKTLTLSFWVKSNVTGTYAWAAYTPDSNMNIGGTYTIDSAGTWEYKTISIDPLTTSAGIANDNGSGLEIWLGVLVGSNWAGSDNTSWASFGTSRLLYGHTASCGTTTNDYIQITGVQLEVGSVATPFEHRSYGEELALCQRYFERQPLPASSYALVGCMFNSTNAGGTLNYTYKRAVPSITLPSAGQSANTISWLDNDGGYPSVTGSNSASGIGRIGCRITGTGYTFNTSIGTSVMWVNNSSTDANIDIDAEL